MGFSAAVRPLYRYIYFRFRPESKVYSEVALRDVIATASDLINLYLVASLDTETGPNGRPAWWKLCFDNQRIALAAILLEKGWYLMHVDGHNL